MRQKVKVEAVIILYMCHVSLYPFGINHIYVIYIWYKTQYNV
jgi:hypothetical protein